MYGAFPSFWLDTVTEASVPHVIVVPLIVPRRTYTSLLDNTSPTMYTIFVVPVSWNQVDTRTMLAVVKAVFFVFTQSSPFELGSYWIVVPS